MTPIPFPHALPDGFAPITWHGNSCDVADAAALVNRMRGSSVFTLELTEEERRQLVEGNPIYLVVVGHVRPFFATTNLGEALDMARQ